MSLPHCLRLVVVLAACRAPGPAADPVAARQACDLDRRDRPSGAVLDDGVLQWPLSRECAAHLGRDLGLDWSSFGRSPEPVSRVRDGADGVVAGAFLLIAAEHGPIDALLTDELAPDLVAVDLLVEARRVGLSGDADAGGLLYAWVTARVDRIGQADGLWDYAARYSAADRTIHLAPETSGFDRPVWMASLLVHEATHLQSARHVDCPDDAGPDCDSDLSGPYGFQAWAARSWWRGLAEASPEPACLDAQATVQTACGMVLRDGGHPLCAEVPSCD